MKADVALVRGLHGVGDDPLEAVRFFRVIFKFVPVGAGKVAAAAANAIDLKHFDAGFKGAGEIFHRRTRLNSGLFASGLMSQA